MRDVITYARRRIDGVSAARAPEVCNNARISGLPHAVIAKESGSALRIDARNKVPMIATALTEGARRETAAGLVNGQLKALGPLGSDQLREGEPHQLR